MSESTSDSKSKIKSASEIMSTFHADYFFLKDTENPDIIEAALKSGDPLAEHFLSWNPLLSGGQIEVLYALLEGNFLDQLRLLNAPNVSPTLIHFILVDGKVKDARKSFVARHTNASEESTALWALLTTKI